MIIDHVALVVADLYACAARVAQLGLDPGPVEEFPQEGTREQYWGPESAAARLLLLQPIGSDGPYHRALTKRGPGLHHVALHRSIESFLGDVTGWLVHGESFAIRRTSNSIWLARPGVGTLLEVGDGEPFYTGQVLDRVEVPVSPAGLERVVRRGCGQPVNGFEVSPDEDAWLTWRGDRFRVADLVG